MSLGYGNYHVYNKRGYEEILPETMLTKNKGRYDSYEELCKIIFHKNCTEDNVLDIEAFKKFTIECARAIGYTAEDVKALEGEGDEKDQMWQMMFR